MLERKPFEKRFDRKPLAMFEFENLILSPIGVITTLLQKGLTEKSLTAQRDQPAQRLRLSLRTLSSALSA
ncbi:MAG TPA: hypothetical protein VN414_12820 [Methanosarcina sp.]|nr:hypothetical protein [Methanosarcina sp.]